MYKKLINRLDECITKLQNISISPSILTTDAIFPSLLANFERLKSLQTRLSQAVTDVINDKDETAEKQRLLDAADRIHEQASRKSEASSTEGGSNHSEAKQSVEGDALVAFYIGVSFLGAGSERLEGETKRTLIKKILMLSALILDVWTRNCAKVDFRKVKLEMTAKKDTISTLSKSDSPADMAEAKRTIETIVDLLEFTIVARPLHTIATVVCEEARDNVLAESIKNTVVDDDIENLVRNIWLADIDTKAGAKSLLRSIRKLPKARFLRIVLASHLILRVYWKHWSKSSRIALLDIAEESMKISGLNYDNEGILRLIEREKGSVEKGL